MLGEGIVRQLNNMGKRVIYYVKENKMIKEGILRKVNNMMIRRYVT